MNTWLKHWYDYDLSRDGDTWATVNDCLFAIADLLHHSGELVPVEWNYWHSVLCEGEEKDSIGRWLAEDLKQGQVTHTDLVKFGNLLNRYASILEAEGRSY